MITYHLLSLVLMLQINSIDTKPSHDFHLSNTIVNFDSKSRSIQVSLRLFIDDLEFALSKMGHVGLKIGSEKENSHSNEFIEEYLRSHFILVQLQDTLKPLFLGKELSDDIQAIWCYLEYSINNIHKQTTITNTILLDEFDDQINLVTIKNNKVRIKDYVFNGTNYLNYIEF